MKCLRFFLSVLALALFLSSPILSQDYSKLSDQELIQLLETQLKKQETLCNQQAEQLQSLETQLKNQSELVKTLNSQIASLQIQLQLAGEYYKNSKNEKLKSNIIVGITSFSAGFFSGTVNQLVRD